MLSVCVEMANGNDVMNCFEFRKLALSNPYSELDDFLNHRLECAECDNYLTGVLSLDEKLAASMSVAVPEDLKAKLKLRQVIDKEQRVHKRFKRYSYAASTVLAVTVGWFAYQNHQLTQAYEQLHDAVVQHIDYEPFSLTSVQPTAQTRMQAHLASYADVRVPELKGLRYSQLCPIGSKKTWHAVMDTPSGVVTIIYFKDGDYPEAETFKDDMHSQIVERKEGNLMLLSKSKEAIPEALDAVNKSLTTLI